MKAVRDHAATIVAGAVVIAVIVGAFAFLAPRPSGTSALVARIHDANGTAHELPLDRNDKLTVETSLGTNVVVVEDGSARMLEADCPNGNCLHQAPISQPGQQIICLPHKLWIEIVEAGAPDGTLDESRVNTTPDGADLVSR